MYSKMTATLLTIVSQQRNQWRLQDVRWIALLGNRIALSMLSTEAWPLSEYSLSSAKSLLRIILVRCDSLNKVVDSTID